MVSPLRSAEVLDAFYASRLDLQESVRLAGHWLRSWTPRSMADVCEEQFSNVLIDVDSQAVDHVLGVPERHCNATCRWNETFSCALRPEGVIWPVWWMHFGSIFRVRMRGDVTSRTVSEQIRRRLRCLGEETQQKIRSLSNPFCTHNDFWLALQEASESIRRERARRCSGAPEKSEKRRQHEEDTAPQSKLCLEMASKRSLGCGMERMQKKRRGETKKEKGAV